MRFRCALRLLATSVAAKELLGRLATFVALSFAAGCGASPELKPPASPPPAQTSTAEKSSSTKKTAKPKPSTDTRVEREGGRGRLDPGPEAPDVKPIQPPTLTGNAGGSGPDSHPTAEPVEGPKEIGRFSWNLPTAMTVGEQYSVYAFVDPPSAPLHAGTGEGVSIKTAARMKVVIESAPKGDIEFEPVGGGADQVLEEGHAVWEWQAFPRKTGSILVAITAKRYVNTDTGVAEQKAMELSAKRRIVVKVGPTARKARIAPVKEIVENVAEETPGAISKAITGGIVAGLTAAAAWGWKKVKKKSPKKDKPTPPDQGIV